MPMSKQTNILARRFDWSTPPDSRLSTRLYAGGIKKPVPKKKSKKACTCDVWKQMQFSDCFHLPSRPSARPATPTIVPPVPFLRHVDSRQLQMATYRGHISSRDAPPSMPSSPEEPTAHSDDEDEDDFLAAQRDAAPSMPSSPEEATAHSDDEDEDDFLAALRDAVPLSDDEDEDDFLADLPVCCIGPCRSTVCCARAWYSAYGHDGVVF